MSQQTITAPQVTLSNKRASHIRNLYPWDHANPIKSGDVVLITGAASGIAQQLAYIYAVRGCKLVLCDFNEQGLLTTALQCRLLRQQANPSQYTSLTTASNDALSQSGQDLSPAQQLVNDSFVIGLRVNVTQQADCEAFIALAVQQFSAINALILCAGIGAHNVFAKTEDLAIFKKCIDVNYYGYLHCTYAAFPYLIKSRGVLTAITSFSGEVGLPFRTAYCASKFAVTGFLEALRAELEDFAPDQKFDITIVCPPTTNTNLRANSLTTDEQLKNKHSEASAVAAGTADSKAMTVEDCASCIVDATDRRLRKAFFPFGSAVASYLRPLIPDQIDRKIWAKSRL